MFDVTTWTAHATREPQPSFLERLDARWREHAALSGADCVWQTSALHSLALVHTDRATHRRRLRAHYFGAGTCALEDEGHGFTPMSDLMPHDQYGPELLRTQHTGKESPLAVAFDAAKADRNLAAVAVLTEDQFTGIDSYLDHSAASLQPEIHGAVIPFVLVEEQHEGHLRDVEDLLHVNGFSTYGVNLDTFAKDPIDGHRELAVVMEDVFDSIAGIKADAAARILLHDPRWPIVMLQGSLN